MKVDTFLQTLRLSAIATATTLLAACAVGPDYARPTAIESSGFSPQALPNQTASTPAQGGASQRFVKGQDIRADWWQLFQSYELNALIAKSFSANPNLESAQAALRAAQENVYAQRGFFYPSVQTSYSMARTKLAGNAGGSSPGIQGDGSVISTGQGTPASDGGTAPFNAPVLYNFHTAQLTVGYTPDIFGSNQRQLESLEAQAASQQFQLEAAYITLASNIVAAAIQDAMLRQQIAITQEIISDSTTALDLLRRQVKAGYASRLDLANQENAFAQVRLLLPPLTKQFEQNRNLLRALSGAAQDTEIPAFALQSLHLPEELPASLPSQLVEQRPDVRAAEEQLHAASAQIGVARAARLPQFSISASAGGAASNFGQMFWDSGTFFNLALGISQTIFDGGTLKHRERAAEAAMRQAASQYRSTVITAFQNVADSLQAIHIDAQAMQTASDLATAAKTTLNLTQHQYVHGYLDRLALINAQQGDRQAQLSLVQAQGSRLGDTAVLFQALGGGWWHRNADAATTVLRAPP